MNLTIDHEVLIRALLKGNMCDSVVITDEFYNAIAPQCSAGILVFEPCDLYNKKGYILWSDIGWENELKRRAYLDGLPESVLDYQHVVKKKPNIKELQAQLIAASMKGDLDEATRISMLIKELSK